MRAGTRFAAASRQGPATPGYREAKARTFAEVAPEYVDGQQGVDAIVDTPQGPVESPQVVLVSHNPYHISTVRHLGRRFALDAGQLGGIVLKRPAGAPPPDLLPRLRRELRRQGHAGRPVKASSLGPPPGSPGSPCAAPRRDCPLARMRLTGDTVWLHRPRDQNLVGV